MTPTRTTSRLPTVLVGLLLALGCWQVGEGSWIYAKAGLAQLLLQRAWARALAGEPSPKPWPWADTWPVTRLHMNRPNVDVIVLSGAYGRTLAFGPGHVSSTSLPGQAGTMIVTGHRDTHFRFLKDVRLKDELELTRTDGVKRGYRVTDVLVLDSRRDVLPLSSTGHDLLLVTCFPFDAIKAGGPLRYVVRAASIE
jgi:sortase A